MEAEVTNQNHTTSTDTNSDEDDAFLENLELFFSNDLQNSCEATDKLILRIERSKDESLARRALIRYQDHYLSLREPWNHVNFMYGLGILYMHFNAYNWAAKAFREATYIEPSFTRSRDAHARLGFIFKSIGRYKLSEKHFKLAIKDKRPNSGRITDSEIEFHLAHLAEIQGRLEKAKEVYQKLLQDNTLPKQLSANIERQLGWVCFNLKQNNNSTTSATAISHPWRATNNRKNSMLNHNINSLSDNNNNDSTNANNRLHVALNYLSNSNQTLNDPNTSYFLGRLYTNVGKFQDAFSSYKTLIDREEPAPDTWCSIGTLYHRQNQPTDALRAYIKAVQSDKRHTTAWLNLGILYESHRQFKDALKCYQHALRSKPDGCIDETFQDRIIFMQRQLAEIESTIGNTSAESNLSLSKLLPLEDLWNLECKMALEANNTEPQNAKATNCDQTNFFGKQDIDFPTTNNTNCAPAPSQQTQQEDVIGNSTPHKDRHLSNNNDLPLNAKRMIDLCKKSHSQMSTKKLDVNLLSDDFKPPEYFPKSPPYPPLQPDKLFPVTPSIFVETKKDLLSKKIQDCCQSSPISIVRNIASVLKLDLGLFSTKTLVECNPTHPVDTFSHTYTATASCDSNNADESNSTGIPNSWICHCQKSNALNISRYANYQVSSFREYLREESDQKHPIGGIAKNVVTNRESETDSNESASQNNPAARISTSNHNIHLGINSYSNDNHSDNKLASNNHLQPSFNAKGPPAKKAKKESPRKTRHVTAANSIDLSDEKIWRPQLNELSKLPNFMKCVSASNMLTHTGAIMPGLNTISMSMHILGCKVCGRRTPDNFCSANINVGPGEYEWFAVASDYGGIMSKLCNRYQLELDDDNWWPVLKDLQTYNIPIYRFSQRPGDLVWINSGTLTWYQSVGWCNNIHWNVGPLCARQYKLAAESFELNKYLFRKSRFSMIQLTWNIVININIVSDGQLHKIILEVLNRSLRYCMLVRELIDLANQKICDKHDSSSSDTTTSNSNSVINMLKQPSDVIEPKVAKFCSLCECEVFNIHFIDHFDLSEPQESYCVECARRMDPTFQRFKITQDYDLKYLMKLYDNFIETRNKFKYHHRQQQLQAALTSVKIEPNYLTPTTIASSHVSGPEPTPTTVSPVPAITPAPTPTPSSTPIPTTAPEPEFEPRAEAELAPEARAEPEPEHSLTPTPINTPTAAPVPISEQALVLAPIPIPIPTTRTDSESTLQVKPPTAPEIELKSESTPIVESQTAPEAESVNESLATSDPAITSEPEQEQQLVDAEMRLETEEEQDIKPDTALLSSSLQQAGPTGPLQPAQQQSLADAGFTKID